ncbi:LOW QUALITY PROTEIN: glycoprotein-N-acetylgalactosamine 3-beta-galactosyltransferase 1 [Drosophila gunungcola]|uniref:LOW QUALITY PROTEIN: glycoprotein-N-acetylgalactosamine 3-beta-galactosyltransferase 1 n=1 Tax=Drosophila gunungcola TaxID=103775 RepID=UPI0022E94A4E|nr:LOW QUALITY PROTEIN: glycoprotein-N-acetylgalactosamine 3-beta-galactosyltransferase 1 [Drosophila gunungcola]
MAKRLRRRSRQFNTRRLFLCGKNRFTLCTGIYLLLLGTACFLIIRQVCRDFEAEEVAVSVAPPPRIFCIIKSYAYRHEHASIHIHRTWAKHCDHHLFVSDDVHPYLEPAVFLNLHDKWLRLRAHLEYVYKYHFDQGDWFLYANDDNFVVVENLRDMLKSYSPDELIYFGCKLRTPNGLVFMYEGSGIVFSGAALKRFTLAALTNESICSSKGKGNEATEELGRCLTNVNVIAGNSRDEWQGHRFLPFEYDVHLGGQLNESLELHKYFLSHSYYPVIDMNLPVSLRSICSHLNNINNIYDMYYFTYKVRVFGVPFDFESDHNNLWNRQHLHG